MVEIENCDPPRRCRGRPQIRSDEVTRALIIEAARQEFEANGYAATSIANVAQRACVSTKTLYRLIPTKAELFRSVVSERVGRFVLGLERELTGLDSLNAAEALERILTAFGTLTLDPGPIAMTRLVLGECRGFPEIATAFYESATKRTSDVMERALSRLCQRGLIAVDDPREATDMLRGMMIMEPQRAAMLGQVEPPAPEEIASRARRCARMFLDGCRVRAQWCDERSGTAVADGREDLSRPSARVVKTAADSASEP
jgi:AcrR family transcriptional regulator